MYEFDILDLNDSLEIINNGKKIIYNVDNAIPLSEWVRKEIKSFPQNDQLGLFISLDL